MQDNLIQQLLNKPERTSEEELQLQQLLRTAFEDNLRYDSPVDKVKAAMILKKIHEEIAATPARVRVAWWRYAAAAAVMVIVAGTGWLLRQKTAAPPAVVVQEIPPGRSGAVLTLADGRQVTLDSAGNGVVAREGGVDIKLNNQQLVYSGRKEAGAAVGMNLLSTPRSRQFQLLLPDGTRVWLNAASSIRYPAVFTGKERKVEITGEAYLEVAENASHPFVVTAGAMQLQVLGTAFNVNAYADEPVVAATLVSGSVRVVKQQAAPGVLPVMVKPGQQAVVAYNVSLRSDVDISAVTAWKNGQFNFEQAGVQEVMRQIARWYDVEVRYEGVPPQREFHGGVGRDFTLQQVLTALRKTGVRCRLEGRTVIVERSPE